MQRFTSLLFLLTLVPLAAAPAAAQWSTQALSQARLGPVAVSVGDLALFAGGEVAGTPSAVVDVYDDASGMWSTAKPLSVARTALAATRVGHLALFAGGADSLSTETAVVDIYDASKGAPSNPAAWSTATLSQARFNLAATTVGSKAIFAGGATGGISSPNAIASDVVDIYDASKGAPSNPAAWSTATLSEARGALAAATAGNRALFAGGFTGAAASATVDIYDDTTGLWCTASLWQARARMGATAVGMRAYFGGGSIAGSTMTDVVDIYDASKGAPCNPAAWSTAKLSVARGLASAAAVGNTILFAGGLQSGFVPSDVVDMLNVGTGHWSSSASLSQARAGMGATSVGGKALFAGGSSGFGSPHAVVDVYEPVGVNHCIAAVNSTGCAASISATGSTSLAANDLTLSSVCVPDGFFLFFHGASQAQAPFGNGYLCAGGGLVRIPPPSLASGGLAQKTVDLPSAGITSPGARNFQCWFRDPGAGGANFNLSDAIEITFVP
jgi:hypothetical protein